MVNVDADGTQGAIPLKVAGMVGARRVFASGAAAAWSGCRWSFVALQFVVFITQSRLAPPYQGNGTRKGAINFLAPQAADRLTPNMNAKAQFGPNNISTVSSKRQSKPSSPQWGASNQIHGLSLPGCGCRIQQNRLGHSHRASGGCRTSLREWPHCRCAP